MIDSSKLKRADECRGKLKEIVGNDGLIELAKNGICPHYVITNPLTGEQAYYFIPSELNYWLENNYINEVSGDYKINNFVNITELNTKPTSKIPQEQYTITNLKELVLTSANLLPSVYFLCKDEQIQYIGKSVYLHSRISQHFAENVKEWDSIFYINCPINKLDEMEASLIKFYQPPLNKTCKLGLADFHIENVNALMK